LGGLVGTVGCGIPVAHLSSERGLVRVVGYALIADVVSSVVVFVSVYVAYVTTVWLAEGIALIEITWFSMVYTVLGGAIAVPVAITSLGITGISATVISLIKQWRPVGT
jgi:hypothetical protein